MRKFLPENGRIARNSDQSFESSGPATGLGKRPPGLVSHFFCHCRFWRFRPTLTADRTGRIEGRTVTTSSCSVKGRPSTSDILSTPGPFRPCIYADYGATNYGNPSSDARLGRDFGTSGDGDRTRSKEHVMVGSLCIEGGENDEDEPEDDGGDDDDDGDDHGDDDDDESVPVAHASSFGYRPAPGKGKGLTGSFMSVMSKIAGSRQKRPKKSCPTTNPT
ncbi:hypothetical protein M9H77_30756 [Catharanthus roseus]|uniref:Uncharacterized protein n=1 Tax=Catharanthus roseus TaxID=4058 RepID=A0ACB9ZZ06_CATRO|nr:hypothetical protein M9H77_30756 [Catharanthus roseus]